VQLPSFSASVAATNTRQTAVADFNSLELQFQFFKKSVLLPDNDVLHTFNAVKKLASARGNQTSSPWNLMVSWFMLIHAHFFRRPILTSKVGHTDLVFGVRSDSLVGMCTQDYKSPCKAITICFTLINIQTHICPHTHTNSILISLFDKLSQVS